ncbi:hypothetical protein QE152_g1752 [Popillia japonica]|uniref:Uncharacterized protein n=1 Tax=Popillia japonica TaxID=7064 RepID=A0AAW1N5F6_POPJA
MEEVNTRKGEPAPKSVRMVSERVFQPKESNCSNCIARTLFGIFTIWRPDLAPSVVAIHYFVYATEEVKTPKGEPAPKRVRMKEPNYTKQADLIFPIFQSHEPMAGCGSYCGFRHR